MKQVELKSRPARKKILFIHGAGDEGYKADAKLAASLQAALGATYYVRYPQMPSDEAAPDFGWLQQIGKEIVAIEGKVILVGHSLGASLLLKYLSENEVTKRIGGAFLISTPFWSGDEDWKQGLKLQENFTDNLPKDVPIFLYHCKDDEVVPLAHLALYAQKLSQAIDHEIPSGGHQVNNDLTLVAKDIKSL